MQLGTTLKKWLLGKPATATYKPTPQYRYFTQNRDLPRFTHLVVQAMLLDPTIRLGLAMRAAPLCSAEFAYKDGDKWVPGIKADNPKVADYVHEQMQRIWRNELPKLLAAQTWGWAAAEVTYRLNPEGRVEVDSFLSRAAEDVRAMTTDSKLSGVQFKNVKGITGPVDVQFPKSIWHAYKPEHGKFYGVSACFGALSPWADKNLEGGALDVRRLFMHKDAYGGADMTYPPGTTNIDGKGEIPNRDTARELVEQIKAGGVTARPYQPGTDGKNQWELTRATVPSNPEHILRCPKDLDVEELRGMEIPDDVLTSEATGAWAGKAVPQQAFYQGLDIWLNQLVADIVTQVSEWLVLWNFGAGEDFEVTTKPLAEQAMSQQEQTREEGNTAFENGRLLPSVLGAGQGVQMSLGATGNVAELAAGQIVGQAENIVRAARDAIDARVPKPETNGKGSLAHA